MAGENCLSCYSFGNSLSNLGFLLGVRNIVNASNLIPVS